MNSYFHWTISNQLSFKPHLSAIIRSTPWPLYEAEKQGIQTSQIVGTGTAGDDKIRTTKARPST